MFTLKVYRGDRVVQELDLDGPEVKIGRSPDNPVVLADDGKGVSRVHAFIREEGGEFVLYDSNSRNGTFVDGKPIKRMVIVPGQDFVIGPYRLVFGSSDYSGSMPTVVSARATAAPDEAPREGTARGAGREGTARGGATGQTKSGEGSTKSRPAATRSSGSTIGTAQKQGMPVAYVAAGVVAVLIVGAVAVWQLWPKTDPEPEQVVAVSSTTTIPEVTTSIPEPPPDPHAERMAEAAIAMEAAEGMFQEKRYGPAVSEFERILGEYIAPILSVDGQYGPAVELEARAKTRIAEANKITAAAKVPKPPPTPRPGPDDVAPRPGESVADWERRNAEVKQDYALAKKYFDGGDNLAALKLFADLANREPSYLDVSAYVKNAQERLDEQRRQALNEALVLEGDGHKLLTARNLPEAATKLAAAREAFQRAAALQVPGIEKHLADNLERRRAVAKSALDTARTHANQRNFQEARKWYQLVIDLLPSGDALRRSAEDELGRITRGL